ncbi:kanamycin kinase/aminoglycoside 3'-phosphotransferase-2 [Paenibacillus polysaccharolyticus]|uniref:Kanamycin kinase/aminoglycoside 3'-phosphotransferase-2 n=1 Tax=Paenibacillus polysaccharolyticus TaxID=582692 RepID=A0A1G5JFS5_9BACL|nr:phosphotransferase [Paenibacillus polysaccharolyticus]SCY87216.1 kanamycin kinase/aminoglycoside 3'-phosphotransferase-2 [Paenibacillus polysaccharolyticus]
MDNRLSIPSELINLSELVSATAIEKGRHYQSVCILEFSNSVKYVLKEKNVEDSGSLMHEAERLNWLNDIVPVPKVIGYLKENGKEHLVMTYIEGCAAEEYKQEEGQKSLGFILGEGLRKIHNMPIHNCHFNDNLPDKLIDMVRKNSIDRKHEVMDAINHSFPNHTTEQLMDFLEMYKASTEELVFTHGDYGSGNVMIHKGRIAAFIDVGASGISDPYYDIYYLVKSLTFYTDKEEEVEEFVEGYGISELDENRMKFHQIIDTLLL